MIEKLNKRETVMGTECVSLDKIDEIQVFVVSASPLQSELMAGYIETRTGARCKYWNDKSPLFINEDLKEKKCLILLDCSNMDADSIKEAYVSRFSGEHLKSAYALFNVNSGNSIETEAFDLGVQGIFYENDSPEILAKGIISIRDGELWFSRSVMTKCLMDNRYRGGHQDYSNLLTFREKEILMMIASGIPNCDIADQLHISPNTVKTHITNIYHKIDVPNRVQAALWAVQNLS